MSSRARLLIIIFIVTAVVIIGGAIILATFGKGGSSKSAKTLPIGPEHPSVVNVVATYTFSGKIETMDNDSIALKSSGAPLPEFKITERTPVFVKGKDKPTRSTQEELKKMANPEINLTASYDFESGNWTTTSILLNVSK